MDFLLEHPTSMPVEEAAMTYLFTDAPPVLRLVPMPQNGFMEEGDEWQAACGGGA